MSSSSDDDDADLRPLSRRIRQSLHKAASLSSSDSAESEVLVQLTPSKEIDDLELWKDPRADRVIANLLASLKKDQSLFDSSSDSGSSSDEDDERPNLRVFKPQELRSMLTVSLSSLTSSSDDGGWKLQRQTRLLSFESETSDAERPLGN